jgi:hypothetical protein
MTDSKFKITKINETMCKRGYEVVLKKLIVKVVLHFWQRLQSI